MILIKIMNKIQFIVGKTCCFSYTHLSTRYYNYTLVHLLSSLDLQLWYVLRVHILRLFIALSMNRYKAVVHEYKRFYRENELMSVQSRLCIFVDLNNQVRGAKVHFEVIRNVTVRVRCDC